MKKNTTSIDNLFTMAQQAEAVKNYQEAYQYYNRILEINPTNPKALLGKGLAVGWLSTFAAPRYVEAVDVITLGIKNCSDFDFKTYIEGVTDGLDALATAHFGKLRSNFTKMEYGELKYQKPFLAYLPDILHLWCTALIVHPKEEYAHHVIAVYEELTASLDNLLLLQTNQLAAAKLQFTLEEAEKYLKKIHPEYITKGEKIKMEKEQREREKAEQKAQEQAAAKKKSGCFIATAVYGDYDAPEVMALRGFRDNTLQSSLLGRRFIKSYYAISPPFAEWLKKHRSISNFIKKLLDVFVMRLQG